MKGVNINNEYSNYYKFEFKNYKLWRSIFFHLLEITIINSFIIYKNLGGAKYKHKQFRLIIIDKLIPNHEWKTQKDNSKIKSND